MRRNTVVAGLAALLFGAGCCLAVEHVVRWAPFGGVTAPRPAAVTCHDAAPAGRPASTSTVEICVEPVSASPADELLISLLAALVGGLLGVGTFVAGRLIAEENRRREGASAVTVVIEEFAANRGAITRFLNPPPGTTARAEPLSTSVFRQLRVQLAYRLQHELLAETFRVYSEIEAQPPDYSGVARTELERLQGEADTLETKLRPQSGQG